MYPFELRARSKPQAVGRFRGAPGDLVTVERLVAKGLAQLRLEAGQIRLERTATE